MAQQQLEFLLALDNSKFNRALKASQAKVAASSKKMAASVKPAIAGFGKLSKTIGLVGTAAAAAAGAAGLYALNSALRESIDLANEQEAAEAKLEAVVKATGGAAGLSAAAMKQYASDLQDVTTFGDEVTISAMAILASFKQIKGDEFKRATAAAQDMATVMGTDLNSAVLQIGKALNDPIKGISALSRAGVQFTNAQKEQIKTLQESGNLLGAQKIILAELEGQFGGAAAAARNTFGGMSKVVKGARDDFKEAIGRMITKNKAFIEGLKFVEQQFKTWTAQLDGNRQATQQWAKQAGIAVLDFSVNAVKAAAASYGMFNSLNKTLLLSYTSVLRLASGALYYQKVIAGLKGDEAAVNRLHKERLNLQYDIEQAYENIMNGDQSADKANQWAKNAAAKILALKKTIEETKIDPSETFDDADDNVGQKLVKIGDTWTNVTETSMAAVNDELEKGMDVSEETAKTAGKAIVTDWKTFFDDMEKDTSDSVSAIISQLERLQAAASSASAAASAATGYKTGGMIQKFASGGKLSGYGGGDRIPALLEAGEFIIRKEAVARLGAGLFSRLNSLHLPKFATGGPVMAGVGGSGGSVTVNFAFPEEVNQPRGSFSPADAETLMRILKRRERLSSH